MRLKYLLSLCFVFALASIYAQEKWEPEEFTNSSGKVILVYPNDKVVTKENHDLAVKLCGQAGKYYAQKNFDLVKRMAEEAILADPYYWYGYYWKGVFLQVKIKYSQAIENFEVAIKYSQNYYYLYSNIAICFSRLKQYEKAKRYAKKALTINSKHGRTYFELAFCYGQLDEHKEAISAYTEALILGYDETSIAYQNRGRSYQLIKDYPKARRDYNKAIELNPENEAAKRNLASLEKIAPSGPGTVWLIAVGINNYANKYKLSQLSFPTKGAYEFARIFESKNMLKERAVILTDAQASRSGILKALDDLHKSGKVKYNDMVLFYFSGHGEMAGDNIGICPHNYAAPRDLISDGEISKRLNRFAAKHKVAIIEACKTEVQTASPIPADKLVAYNSARKNISGGLAYITSTRAGMVSYGTSDGGYFTTHLRNALDSSVADKDGNKVISLQEMFEYVRKQTSAQTNGEQVPEINRSGFNMNMPMMILE